MTTFRWRGWLAAGSIFVFGFACGVGGTVGTAIYLFRGTLRAPASRPALVDHATSRISADLRKRLALSGEEAARVDDELKYLAAAIKAVRIDATRRAVAEVHVSIARIENSLPEEKREAFRAIAQKRLNMLGLPLETPAEAR